MYHYFAPTLDTPTPGLARRFMPHLGIELGTTDQKPCCITADTCPLTSGVGRGCPWPQLSRIRWRAQRPLAGHRAPLRSRQHRPQRHRSDPRWTAPWAGGPVCRRPVPQRRSHDHRGWDADPGPRAERGGRDGADPLRQRDSGRTSGRVGGTGLSKGVVQSFRPFAVCCSPDALRQAPSTERRRPFS